MSAAPDYSPGWSAGPAADLAAALAAAEGAVDRLATEVDLATVAKGEAAGAMGALTTLVARLDGLRVGLAQVVAERGLYGQRGARNLVGWLSADARVADDAWKLSRLAAAAPQLPKITGLLGAGSVSLSQAATACWQIAHLPHLPRRPDEACPSDNEPSGTAGSPAAADASGASDATLAPGNQDLDDPGPVGEAEPREGSDADDDRWAGLWRLGDVHAAADELFSTVLPRLDCGQLRQLGTHLREAADAQQRVSEDNGDFARRGLRISRSLYGATEITGRLHAEAAEQVIAAFEGLGGETGPDDTRTKAQRWADVLTRLCATAAPGGPAAAAYEDPLPSPAQSQPGRQNGQARDEAAGPTDDDSYPAGAVDGTGHDHGQTAHGPAEAGRGARPGDVAAPGTDRHGGRMPTGVLRPRLIVTVPLATLLRDPLAPGATVLGPGTPLTAEAARRLACDAQLIRLVTNPQPVHRASTGPSGDSRPPGRGQPSGGPPGTGPPGDAWNATVGLAARLAVGLAQLPPPLAGPSAVLDIGRASPGWTPRQRDALSAQYGGRCAHPGCGGPIDVLHHLVHWADGGRTSITNGIPCCLFHHWLVHEGGWRVIKHADGTITAIPPPPGWRPGTLYRHGKPLPE